MKITFTDDQLGQGKYLGFDGEWLVRVAKLEDKTSQAGNKVISITLQDTASKKVATENLTIVSSTMFKIAHYFRACGFTDQDLKNGIELNETVGKVIVLKRKKTGTKTINGKERADYDVEFAQPTTAQIEAAGGHLATASDIPDFGDDDVA